MLHGVAKDNTTFLVVAVAVVVVVVVVTAYFIFGITKISQ
jgi:hypothetical protein